MHTTYCCTHYTSTLYVHVIHFESQNFGVMPTSPGEQDDISEDAINPNFYNFLKGIFNQTYPKDTRMVRSDYFKVACLMLTLFLSKRQKIRKVKHL